MAANASRAAVAQVAAQAVVHGVPAGPLADALNRFALKADGAIAIDAN